jgi:hypothetical protein
MEIVILMVEVLRRMLQRAGPYLMVEIVLPGGTLLALALALYRHRKSISMRRPRRSTSSVSCSRFNAE